eukprot:m.714830 g.714830  ORF g.714830 m.714830 type:complete len:132 (+) comp22973_c1_seq1:21-416(+)
MISMLGTAHAYMRALQLMTSRQPLGHDMYRSTRTCSDACFACDDNPGDLKKTPGCTMEMKWIVPERQQRTSRDQTATTLCRWALHLTFRVHLSAMHKFDSFSMNDTQPDTKLWPGACMLLVIFSFCLQPIV